MKKLSLLILIIILVSCEKEENANEAPAQISIRDTTVMEGNGLNVVQLEVLLSNASSREVKVMVNTVDGSAKAGKDYTGLVNEQLVIMPGVQKKTFAVQLMGNAWREEDKNFTVRLSGAENGFIVKAQAIITIKNDDAKIFIPQGGYEAPDHYAGYTLQWNDEFDGNVLDAASWTYEIGDGCPQLCGWGNNELQYYTNSRDNLYFQDGKMIIEARQEVYSGKNYTSARIKTAGKKSFRFGRIDIRASLPSGKGIWPALWMLPEPNALGSWPTSGEIDIMELIGSEPEIVHGTVHYGPGPGSTTISRSKRIEGGVQNEFHVYSLEWEEDEIRWYIDGSLYSTVNKNDIGTATYPFNEAFYFVMNLAVGGNWPGAPDQSTNFPQRLIVDYIRVYQ